MRAVSYDRWRGPLTVGELPAPDLGPRQVRVRVHAAALNPKDVIVHSGRFWFASGRRFPRVPGYDYAGTVIGVGHEVQWTSSGAEVWGFTRGFRGGALAEELVVGREEVGLRPARLTAEEACALPLVGCTVLQGFRDRVHLRQGERVLVHGASGGVGTIAIQIARVLGAIPTAVCSAGNAELVRGLGAEDVLAYDRGDLERSTGRWDVVVDAFGTLPYAAARRYLAPGGRHLSLIVRASALLPAIGGAIGLLPASFVSVRNAPADYDQLARWVEAGVLRPVIDEVLPLERAEDGFVRVRSKRARGKVVITVRG